MPPKRIYTSETTGQEAIRRQNQRRKVEPAPAGAGVAAVAAVSAITAAAGTANSAATAGQY